VKHLSWGARVYVTTVIVAGAVVLGCVCPRLSIPQPALFITLYVVSCLSAAIKISLPLNAGASTMSVSYTVDFASLLLLGIEPTVVVAAATAVCQCVLNKRMRQPLHRTLFSVAALVVTVAAAGFAFEQLQSLGGDPLTAVARPLVGAATTYFLLNSSLVAAAVAMSTRQPIFSTWQTHFLWSAPSYFVGAGAAALGAWIVRHVGLWLAPLMFAPVYLTYRTYRVYIGRLEAQRHVQETSDLHLATVEALAAAIDAKDRTARTHLPRVQAYAAGLAEAIGLSPEEIQAVKTAALLHDIGKLAIPAQILSKPGPLTPEEFARVRIHPQIGAEILSSVPFPYPVAPLVLSHHERWDGAGYPQGQRGEAIPIGARILAVVDCYDVATSNRPYRPALSHDDAITRLHTEAGHALDPRLVDVFIDRLPRMKAAFEAAGSRAATSGPSNTCALTSATAEPNAFENIALAHQEIYTLYEIAQTMGTSLNTTDTMRLIASKLSAIIPWSGCALYVIEQGGTSLHCRFAIGLDAPQLEHAWIRDGRGLSGAVAIQRQTLVNADPRVEFEAAGAAGPIYSRSAIVCPLALGSRLIGVLALFHTDADRYTDDHRRVLTRVADQAAAVISNALMFEQTQEASLTDPLTGLPNRRSMTSRLANEVMRADRARAALAIVVLDIDGFKQVNDTYGHATGDYVLREIARALQETLRPYDLCVRFAGDEFVVVMTDCPPEAAEIRRRELQRRVADIQVSVDGVDIPIGASAGASTFPQDGRTHETLLAVADRRMYADKARRRGASDWQTPPARSHGETAIPRQD
jgi:diguanylate cyclase (GGDEF)-like protein/putative nucleotidyltransferase with HDIG domain